jgi:hypothetical protein
VRDALGHSESSKRLTGLRKSKAARAQNNFPVGKRKREHLDLGVRRRVLYSRAKGLQVPIVVDRIASK